MPYSTELAITHLVEKVMVFFGAEKSTNKEYCGFFFFVSHALLVQFIYSVLVCVFLCNIYNANVL